MKIEGEKKAGDRHNRTDRQREISTKKEVDSRLQECWDLQAAIDRSTLLVRVNSQEIIDYVSDRVCEISQYSRSELIGSKWHILRSGDSQEDSSATPAAELIKNLRSTVAKREIWQGEIQNRRKDGSDYWVYATVVPLLEANGKPIQYVAIGVDITDRKAREAAQAEANRAKDQFLAIASHELRSPLSAILGWVQLARSRKLNETTTNRALEIIERNAKLQNQQIDNLLDLSRLLRGKVQLNLGRVHLPSVIESAIDTLRPAADAKNIRIETIFDPDADYIAADAERLQQIVWNLLSNAIKFTPESQTARVLIEVECIGWGALIRISDSGCGIDAQLLPHIFDCFRPTNTWKTKEQNRLGLGLSIVRQLVELHGGSIRVQSPGVGQGATFEVYLPIGRSKGALDRVPAIAQIESKSAVATKPLAGKRVLVVESSPEIREFLKTALEAFGAKVTAVASAPEGMAELEKSHPDLLVSDLTLPEAGGCDAIRRVRTREISEQWELLPTAPLAGGSPEEDAAPPALEAEFQRHLPKPVEANQLVGAIAQLAGL
ncbi:MAG: PAS domain-containing hybrid sensor histidine kinase/response regulator, partial [Microcoleus sp.]